MSPTAAPRRGRFAPGCLTGAFLLVLLLAVATILPVPYVIMAPGPATNTLDKGLVTIAGTREYPTTGALDFTTVRVVGGPGQRPSLSRVLTAAVLPDQEVFPEEQFFPKGVTTQQVDEENAVEMADSQQVAAFVALHALGEKVEEVPGVARVPAGSPAKGHLRAGDEILAVGDRPVTDTASVQRAVRASAPGTVRVTVRREGKQVEVSTPAVSKDGRTAIGIIVGARYRFPYTVTIDAGDVGGPSAGMMFSLAVYDRLTPGAMTGGRRIAGTGTMSPDGQVGPIGGIRQKIVGARESGAAYFLAPTQDCAELGGHVPGGIQVVRVATFEQARQAVTAIGAGKAQGLPSCG